MRPSTKQRSFSLVELVIMVTVVSIAAAPLTVLFHEALIRNAQTGRQATAVMLASALMEEILSAQFEDPGLPRGSFGTEEASRALYDDADDYNGLDDQPPRDSRGNVLSEYAAYRIRASVVNVAEANPGGSPVANGSTEYKRVTVTVTSSGIGPMRLVGLTTRSSPALAGITYLSRRVKKVEDLEFQIRNDAGKTLYLTHLKLGWNGPTAYYEKVKIMPQGTTKWLELWAMKKMGNRRMPNGGIAMFSGRCALVPAGATAWIKVEKFKDAREGAATNVNMGSASFAAEFWAAPERYRPISIPSSTR